MAIASSSRCDVLRGYLYGKKNVCDNHPYDVCRCQVVTVYEITPLLAANGERLQKTDSVERL